MKKTKLELLNQYWTHGRQLGHTRLIENGVLNSESKCIYIVVNPGQYSNLRGSNIIVNNLDWITEEKMRGLRLPIAIDHFALQILLQEHNDALFKRWNP